MKITLLLQLLSISMISYGQFDFELYQAFQSRSTINRNLISVSEFQVQGDTVLISRVYFNDNGMPDSIIQYSQNTRAGIVKFIYSDNQIKSMETFSKATQKTSTEFQTNALGQIESYRDFAFSSYDQEKMPFTYNHVSYHENGQISELVKMNKQESDTTDHDFFDKKGFLIRSISNHSGLRTKQIICQWNSDSTEMMELKYENDTSVYDTVFHFYENGLEVKRIDNSTVKSPHFFYWKYNSDKQLVESNQQLFYIEYFYYDNEGFLIIKKMKAVPEFNYGNFPEQMISITEYKKKN